MYNNPNNTPIENILNSVEMLRQGNNLATKSRKEQVKYLCELLGFDLPTLATATIFNQPNITATQLAENLGVTRKTLYQWPTVNTMLKQAHRKKNYE